LTLVNFITEDKMPRYTYLFEKYSKSSSW